MENILCLSDLLNIIGRPLLVSCPGCGCSFTPEEVEMIIQIEKDNMSMSEKFIPFKCSNCDKEMSVVDLITFG